MYDSPPSNFGGTHLQVSTPDDGTHTRTHTHTRRKHTHTQAHTHTRTSTSTPFTDLRQWADARRKLFIASVGPVRSGCACACGERIRWHAGGVRAHGCCGGVRHDIGCVRACIFVCVCPHCSAPEQTTSLLTHPRGIMTKEFGHGTRTTPNVRFSFRLIGRALSHPKPNLLPASPISLATPSPATPVPTLNSPPGDQLASTAPITTACSAKRSHPQPVTYPFPHPHTHITRFAHPPCPQTTCPSPATTSGARARRSNPRSPTTIPTTYVRAHACMHGHARGALMSTVRVVSGG